MLNLTYKLHENPPRRMSWDDYASVVARAWVELLNRDGVSERERERERERFRPF
jgi:hypothetical protein